MPVPALAYRNLLYDNNYTDVCLQRERIAICLSPCMHTHVAPRIKITNFLGRGQTPKIDLEY
jgi:hypothetical protein